MHWRPRVHAKNEHRIGTVFYLKNGAVKTRAHASERIKQITKFVISADCQVSSNPARGNFVGESFRHRQRCGERTDHTPDKKCADGQRQQRQCDGDRATTCRTSDRVVDRRGTDLFAACILQMDRAVGFIDRCPQRQQRFQFSIGLDRHFDLTDLGHERGVTGNPVCRLELL